MATHDLNSSKSVRVEEIHQKGKAASMSADSWIQNQAQARSMIESQTETIADLSSRLRTMEQQVKAIARVMASQNVQQLSEHMKLSLEDQKKDIMHIMQEKHKDLLQQVEKDVGAVVDSRAGLLKKMNDVEERLTKSVNAKIEEASRARHALRSEFEDLKAQVVDLPDNIKANTKAVDIADSKINDVKKQLKQLEAANDAANVEQDKVLVAMTSEIRAAHESAKEKLEEDSRALAKSVAKHETAWDEKLKLITELIEKEGTDRQEMCKSYFDRICDKMHEEKLLVERSFHALDTEFDRKVTPVLRSISDVKCLIQEERTLREAADQEIARALAAEKKQRDLDEERMLNMIHSTTATLSKMHKFS
eukprot:TRINITY_DN54647_c0_g1_i1.p1 TRINITY_DN54647_c0_g1~~TRINITY_DN54647_c0_g1_i1.p1  ORF type:complete len:364 (+),score=118.92 TRINITY_DN54647_c0_g1_i1:58-1149(+)